MYIYRPTAINGTKWTLLWLPCVQPTTSQQKLQLLRHSDWTPFSPTSVSWGQVSWHSPEAGQNGKSKWLWLLVKVPIMLKPCQIWKLTLKTLSFPSRVVLKLWVFLGTVECIPSIDISCKFKIRSVECLHDIFLTYDGQVILSNINQSNTFLDWSSNVSWSNKHEHCLNWLVTRMDTPVYKWIISLSDPITIGIRSLPTADGFPGTTFGVWFSWGALWSSLVSFVGLFTDGYLLPTKKPNQPNLEGSLAIIRSGRRNDFWEICCVVWKDY